MSTYNGWTNWETWKVNLEILDGMDASDLNIEHYAPDEAYEAGSMIRDYVEDVITMQYQYDGFVGGIIQAFMNDVNWTELAQMVLDQWVIDHADEEEEQ